MIYLASPYSHPDDTVRENNYRQVSEIAAALVSNGEVVISPITYGHTLLSFKEMPSDWKFWQNFCLTILRKCDKLVVCKMNGWEKSKGVLAEIEAAQEWGIPVEYLNV